MNTLRLLFYFLLIILSYSSALAQDDLTKYVDPGTLSPKNDSKDGLDAYIERMKYSKATGGEDTRFLTPGNNIIGGIEYFERGNYHSAQTQFELAVNADGQNGFSILSAGHFDDSSGKN